MGLSIPSSLLTLQPELQITEELEEAKVLVLSLWILEFVMCYLRACEIVHLTTDNSHSSICRALRYFHLT